jgi:hypothetical protein
MKTKLLLALLCSSFLSPLAYSMGSKKPATGATKPVTQPAPAVTPPVQNPSLDFGEELPADAYLNTSSEIGSKVDTFRNDDELAGKAREKINTDNIDKCFDDNEAHAYFSDQISYYASEMLNDVPAKVGFIGSSYGTSSDDNNYFPTSLIRHPLCESTTRSLNSTIKKVPTQATIDKVNRFAATVNELRMDVLNGDPSAKEALLGKWTKFFSCLAYSESLGSSDSTTSKNVAAKNAPAGYRKPAGVEFYEDKEQPVVSRLNIGMFQFTPNSAGNIQPCIKAWNQMHASKTSCQVNQKASQSDLIKILGSSLQSFNAFCGVHKLIQTFAIQVNTTKTSATHPSNLVNGKLKSNEQRCVTPHFYSGWAYNHFGPFQNSTGSNMNELFTCIENSH